MSSEESSPLLGAGSGQESDASEILAIAGLIAIIAGAVFLDYQNQKKPRIGLHRMRGPIVVKEREIIREKAKDDDGGYYVDSRDHKLKHRFKQKPVVVEDLQDEF